MGSDPIRGQTIRWTFEDGPVAGKTFAHAFATDGHVTWTTVGDDGSSALPAESRARYYVAQVNEDVYAISYLAESGFTLTSVLDFEAGTVVAFASNEKQLFVQHGKFETVKPAA